MTMRKASPSRCALPFRLFLAVFLLLQILALGCSGSRRPASSPGVSRAFERGVASWYGPDFHGRRTANGERYDMHAMTAAHPSLPFGTLVEVRNVKNGRSAVVRINDRGPFKKRRVIDLSYAAAAALGAVRAGTAFVELFFARDGGVPPRYTVQVGAFSEAERALALRRDVARLYPEVQVHADGTWHRVQVGRFADRQQAESLRRELAALGLSSFVVSAH